MRADSYCRMLWQGAFFSEVQGVNVTLSRPLLLLVKQTDTNRPQLKACLRHLRMGDRLHVHSIDRLARSLKDLQELVESLTEKGVSVQFHNEP